MPVWGSLCRPRVLVLFAFSWLVLFAFYVYRTQWNTPYAAKFKQSFLGGLEDQLTFPLSLKGANNANRACRSLLSLTYWSLQVVHRAKAGKTINVITAADQKYLPGIIALVNSTIVHTKNSLAFHIVADGDPESLEMLLHALFPKGRFTDQTVSFTVAQFNTTRVKDLIKIYANSMTDPKVHANPTNYARFYFHELFPKVSTAVYLDPDTVMLGNVAELGTILDHQDEFIYAVAQGLPHTYAEAFDFTVPVVQQSFDKKEPYFNAGVAVINLDRWRSLNMTGVVEHWMSLHRDRRLWSWGTQPPLMAAFYRRYHMLDSSWNVRHLGTKGMVPPLVEFVRAKVLHWNGSGKPWHAACGRDPTCFRACWLPFYGSARIGQVLRRSPVLAALYSDALRLASA